MRRSVVLLFAAASAAVTNPLAIWYYFGIPKRKSRGRVMWGQWVGQTDGDGNDVADVMLNIDEDMPNIGRIHVLTVGSKGPVFGHARIVFSADTIGTEGRFVVDYLEPPTAISGASLGGEIKITA